MDKAVPAACLVIVEHEDKALGARGHVRPLERRGGVGAARIEAVEGHGVRPHAAGEEGGTAPGNLPPGEKDELGSKKRPPGDVCTWAQATTIMQAAIATHLIPVMMVITLRQWLVFVNAGWPDRGRGVSKG